MKPNKLLTFLIISLSLAAFLAGYVLIKRGVGNDYRTKTGSILEKFDNGEQPTGKEQEQTNQGVPFLLTDRRLISPTNSVNRNKVLYYEKNTGRLFELELETKTERAISDKMLPDFVSALWSPNKKEVIQSFYSSSGNRFRYYNLDTDKTADFSPNIRSVAFSPDGNLIAYFYAENSASSSLPSKVMVSQPDGVYQKKLLDTRLDNLLISWPIVDKIALKTPNSEIFLLTQDGKLTKSLESRPAMTEKWSPSGKKMLFSALSENQEGNLEMLLWVQDTESGNEIPLDVRGEASLCVWSIDSVNIFCSLARSPSIDEIYLLNTEDRSRKLISEPNTQIRELMLSTTEDYLLFISASDDKLYGLKISN